jgi:hypothetical protein
MAKAKKVTIRDEDTLKDLEELNEETLIPSEEDIEKLFSAPSVIEVEEVKEKNSMVEVTPIRDSRSFYGGKWYILTKGKKQKVSTEVRNFLLQNKQNPKIKDVW